MNIEFVVFNYTSTVTASVPVTVPTVAVIFELPSATGVIVITLFAPSFLATVAFPVALEAYVIEAFAEYGVVTTSTSVASVIVIVVLVEVIQFIGTKITANLMKKR